jgi:hypothetical protein
VNEIETGKDCKQPFSGFYLHKGVALLLDKSDVNSPLLKVNKRKTTLVLIRSRVYDNNIRFLKQRRKDVKVTIDRLHDNTNDCIAISENRRGYIVDPDTIFQIHWKRREPEVWLIG